MTEIVRKQKRGREITQSYQRFLTRRYQFYLNITQRIIYIYVYVVLICTFCLIYGIAKMYYRRFDIHGGQ